MTGLTLGLKTFNLQEINPHLELMVTTTGILGAFISILCFGLWFWVYSQYKELHRRADEVGILESINSQLKAECEQLRNQVELLTAMREMALVTNDNTLFREMLVKIFGIMESLLESHNIAIYLIDEDAEELKPRVYYNGTETLFEKDISLDTLDDELVHESFNFKRSFSTVEEKILWTSTPLLADNEAIGIVQVGVELHGCYEDQSKFIDRLQYRLEAISKHISLPIKKSYLFDEATVDVLTKLYTKRYFLAQTAKAFEVARAKKQPMSVIMCDIDHFKQVNDNYGHQSGDLVLKGVAATVLETIRGTDTAYRYGGEEIAVLLLGSPGEKALEVAERMRARVKAAKLHGEDGCHIPVTISLGCCEFMPSCDSVDKIISYADKALYQSKENGRNQVNLCVSIDPLRFEQPALVGLDRRRNRSKKATKSSAGKSSKY
ncbi:diguanylate cyclase [Planctomycetota bacterium]